MQRDKKGRFVKKAEGGTQLLKDVLTLRNGKTYKLKQGIQANLQQDSQLTLAMQNPDAYEEYLSQYYYPIDTSSPDNTGGEVSTTSNSNTMNSSINIPGFNTNLLTTPIKLDYNLNAPVDQQGQFKLLQQNKTYGLGPEQKIKITQKDGKYYDERGVEVPISLVMSNPNSYEIGFLEEFKDYDPSKAPVKEDSKGMNLVGGDPLKQQQNQGQKPLDKTKMANFLEFARAGIGAAVNNKIAERALEAEKPFLQDVSESHRSVYGDYRAQIEGEKAAAKLRNMASKPLTADGALQQQMMLDAQIKGQEYIDKGNAQDEALIKQTREAAWAQEKENVQQRQAVAMQNRQAMLMSQKNKAQIENARDSANFSQVAAPLMMGIEQRLRNEGKIQKAYQDYYDDAIVAQEVWNTFDIGLSDSQKALRTEYLTGGVDKVQSYVGTDKKKYNDWLQLQQIMNQEVMKRKAAIKGAFINPTTLGFQTSPQTNQYGIFTGVQSQFKKGGTIYKAKLSKRTKDNDRGAKSIESSKKIAARFLEKAIDSLYSYNDVELIAKPKNKKRKYQAGGGLPFVNFAPVFATSETGTPATKSKEDTKTGEDLTTKDVLELLKDIDGLHSDIDAIQTSLSDFLIADKMDPLGLDSSSSIASRYMSLIGKIKKAKSNREWYDKAYEKLSTNGALNEYAVDSTGHFIGMNQEGDFARFTAQQVASGDIDNYTLLTNSNLLDIRNRYPTAAFNSNLIMEAANGVSMQQITDYINKTIQGLGSDKSQTQVFGDRSKDVLAGLQQLQKAAKEIGQDLSISELYEAQIFTESQAKQAELALSYLYQTLPTNMKALLFAKAGSQEGALKLVNDIVYSKVSTTTKLEFSPKNSKKTSSSKTGNVMLDGLNLSPAQMLQQGFGERESITIQDASSTGLKVDAVTMPITTGSDNKPLGAGTLEDVATSNYGGILNFNNASMGGQIIPFEGRRNIAVDGSKIYSMYLPLDQVEAMKGNIVPDISLIDKVNQVNKTIKEQHITDVNEINQAYVDAGLPVYLNQDGTVVPTTYRRFGVLNGTAIDNAFGKTFVESKYLRKIDDENIINGAISVMNQGRSKEDKIEYDSESIFNFGGLIGDYDSVYQGTIFVPISNDVFLGIAGSGQTITSTEANQLYAEQQQKERVSATYKNPGQLR